MRRVMYQTEKTTIGINAPVISSGWIGKPDSLPRFEYI